MPPQGKVASNSHSDKHDPFFPHVSQRYSALLIYIDDDATVVLPQHLWKKNGVRMDWSFFLLGGEMS